MKENIGVDPLEEAIHILGGRWRAILLYFLLNGPQRFSDLQKHTGISRRILTVNLRVLEEAGLVLRTAYAEVPPRVEYQLTPDGLALRSIIHDLYSWGEKFKSRTNGNGVALSTPLPVE
jgi:DNA-binding HxlR family transcriptional regulator